MDLVVFASASCCTSLTSISISLSATGWLWISHLICQPPLPHLLVFAEAPPSQLPGTKGQSREWHLSEAALPLSFLFCYPAPPSLAWDCLTFAEGRFISSGAPALFRGGTQTGVESRQGDCCKGGHWKGWKVEKWGLRIATQQQKGKQHGEQEGWSNYLFKSSMIMKWIFFFLSDFPVFAC